MYRAITTVAYAYRYGCPCLPDMKVLDRCSGSNLHELAVKKDFLGYVQGLMKSNREVKDNPFGTAIVESLIYDEYNEQPVLVEAKTAVLHVTNNFEKLEYA